MKMNYYYELKKFIVFSNKQLIGQGIVGEKDFNIERKKVYDGLSVEAKVGAGRASRIPWISFLGGYDSVKKGIYPVYLYFKEKNLLILAYGISESNTPDRSWNLKNGKTIKDYFTENGLGEPTSYGGSFVYKAYDLKKELVEDQVDEDLNSLISIYKAIATNTLQAPIEKVKSPIEFKITIEQINFDLNSFQLKAVEAGLIFSTQLIQRFIASLYTKPFVICSGLSGSGKTKLAQAFVQWISESEKQYKIIPVGSDWTNREPLLGYPNGLEPTSYVTPDSGALQLIIEASKDKNKNKPYFMILDEMNLSHVERYFADFLSIMESGDSIKLYSGANRNDSDGNKIEQEICWPKNLFIIGTVNIDETTYMFSPKVLDRANTIEFRVDETNIKTFLDLPSKIDLSVLQSKGASMAKNFLEISQDNSIDKDDEYTLIFVKFFNELQRVGAEFGYRTAVEMLLLIKKLNIISNISKNESIDIAVMQKLLPKLHGSRSKISKVLDALILLCLKDGQIFSIAKSDDVLPENINYPIAFEKLVRMYKNALDNGFTSYAEA